MPFSDKKTKSKYFSKKNRAAGVFGVGDRNLIWGGRGCTGGFSRRMTRKYIAQMLRIFHADVTQMGYADVKQINSA